MSTDMDRIVDEIARKVQDRLAGSLTGNLSQASAGHRGCSSNCNQCGHCASKRVDSVRNLASVGAVRFGSRPGIAQPDSSIAGMIDHTLLKLDATSEQLKQVCDEAKRYSFATVCVNSSNIPFVARQLAGSSVKPIAVVGFPLGAATTSSKAFEAREAVRSGAREIDMVVNLGALKSTDYGLVFDDIQAVVEASKPYPVKVILETGALDHDQKVITCALSKAAGAAFVKTSTGFGHGGAIAEDIALMRKIVGEEMGVKASGGMHSAADVEKMRQAGATRIGASASVAIVTGKKSNSSY